MKVMRICYIVLLMVFAHSLLFADSLNYGLRFKSYDVDKDSRTGIDFTKKEKIYFGQNSSMNFDFKLNTDEYPFGLVFRIIGSDNHYLSLIMSDEGEKYTFVIGSEKQIISSQELIIEEENIAKKWMRVSVSFMKGEVVCRIDDKEVVLQADENKFSRSSFFFGKNTNELYSTTDVPPITLKNVSIYKKKRQIYFWKFDIEKDGYVIDTISNRKADVVNAMWELDGNMMWKDDYSLEIDNANPQVAIDRENNRIFIAYQSTIQSLNLDSGIIDEYEVLEGNPYIGVSSQLIYDDHNNKLISYSIEDGEVITYDFDSKIWAGSPENNLLHYQHHSRIFDSNTEILYVFGGYGIHRYTNEYIKWSVFDNSEKRGKETFVPQIYPRYLSSIADYSKDSLLIIGGYGSISGSQKDSPLNFYDIYRVDKESGNATEIGKLSLTGTNDHYVFGNSSVVKKSNVYTLLYNKDKYNTSISLAEIDLCNEMSMRVLKDSLNFKFIDIRSYADLFLSKGEDKLYALLIQPNDDGAILSIHSINFPPVFNLVSNNEENGVNYLVIAILSILVLGGGFIVIRIILKFNKRKKNGLKLEAVREKTHSGKKTISLIGGFQVFDGQFDITKSFSPIMQQLLTYLIIENDRIGEGVSPQQLEATFWSDIDHKNALNNIRVNMSKLRKLLSSISESTIDKVEGLWVLKLDSEIVCDYLAVMEILKVLQKEETFDVSNIQLLVELSFKGQLSVGINEIWCDKFKSDYSNLLIDILYKSTEQSAIKKNFKLQISIADVILINDSIDERAIALKCRALLSQGQKSQALRYYNAFCSNYLQMMGTEFNKDFSTLINL